MHPTVKDLIEKHYEDQRSEAWYKLRNTMLTASDAAAAIGENPYEKPLDLIYKKCGLVKFTGNNATAHGIKYEDEARVKYENEYNEKVHELGLCQHKIHDWLGASPDGVTESGKLVEIKCPLRRSITNDVPRHYMPQLQLSMEVLGLDECDFIQYKPAEYNWPSPEEFVVINVKRDHYWFEKYLPVMDKFWKDVLFYRENGIELKSKKTRKNIKSKQEDNKKECTIESDPEDDYIDI